MKIPKDPTERFHMWFVRPFNVLRHQKGTECEEEWNGAFISLMIGCSLMERYYRFKSNSHIGMSRKELEKLGIIDYEYRFKHFAADDMGVPRCNIIDFYRVFRNGVQHQGMPRQIIDRDDEGNIIQTFTYSIEEGLPAVPQRTKDGLNIHISVGPWDFTQEMIDKFLSDQPAIDAQFDHGLAEIYA